MRPTDRARLPLILITALAAPGCLEMEAEYTLGADGKGTAKWDYRLQKEMREKVLAYEEELRKVLPQGTALLLPGIPEHLPKDTSASLDKAGLKVTAWKREYDAGEMSLHCEAEFESCGSLGSVRRAGAASVRFDLRREKDGTYRFFMIKEADPEEEARIPGFSYLFDEKTQDLALEFMDRAQALQRKQSRVIHRVTVPGRILDYRSCGMIRLEGESTLVLEVTRETMLAEAKRRKAAKELLWTLKDPLFTFQFKMPEGTEIPIGKLTPDEASPDAKGRPVPSSSGK